MARRVLHALCLLLVALAGLAAAGVAGGWIWLQTDGGQRFLVEHLRAPMRAAGVELQAGRVSGTVLSSLRLRDVSLRLCARRLDVHARSVELAYGLIALVLGRPVIAVTVEAPAVAPARADCAGAATGSPPALPRRVVLRRIQIHDGTVDAGGARLAAIELRGDGVIERDPAGDPAVTLRIDEATARPFAATSDSRVELAGRVAPDGVDLDLAASLARDDLARHASGAQSAGPVSAKLHVAGPPDALRVTGHVTTARGAADLSGTVDAPARRAELELGAARVVVAPPDSDVEVTASAQVRLEVSRGDDGRLRVVLHGHGDYRRRGFDPALADPSAHGEELPGGSWSGTAEAAVAAGALTTRFQIDVVSAGKREAAPASVRLRGRLIVPRAGRPRLVADVAPQQGGTR